MTERLVSEPLVAIPDAEADPLTAIGEPVLPRRFRWRGSEHRVAEVLDRWKELGTCSSGDERYLRKHWYRIRTAGGLEMKIYFERQARTRAQAMRRWWLFTLVERERRA